MPDNARPLTAVKAVIPAAGLATRFLPATKAVPKELLPVVDRPVLQYIVEEAAAAGIGDVLLITGRGKTSMVDHFDRQPYLESRLEAKGDLERLAAVTPPERAGRDLHLPAGRAARPGPRRLLRRVPRRRRAVRGAARRRVRRRGRAAAAGDDRAAGAYRRHRARLPRGRTGRRPPATASRPWTPAEPDSPRRWPACPGSATSSGSPAWWRSRRPDKAPSNLAVVGRYVLPPSIFDAIRRIKPGAGGEIQLTDAMALLLAEGVPVHGVVYRGMRYDTGLPLGYLQAVVQLAAKRPDLGPAFTDWLTNYVDHELELTADSPTAD